MALKGIEIAIAKATKKYLASNQPLLHKFYITDIINIIVVDLDFRGI